jgi:hypothetical protein
MESESFVVRCNANGKKKVMKKQRRSNEMGDGKSGPL